ncbi:MAG TPA: OmpA family protein [Polyangiales bacterium]|jgi:outer membrane protein OmpA-like peptidoglycan-associated protein|nr:OmpA family protein [Polyangiales bacterium]
MARLRASLSTLVLLVLVLAALPARAEPLLVSLEGAGAVALTAPQSDRFGPGVALAASLYYPLSPAFLLGGRLRAGFLANGDPPAQAGLVDPGVGTLESASLLLRVRPLAAEEPVSRARGLFLDLGAGGGMTGSLTRGTLEAGVGFGFGVDSIALAPVLRYVQVMQPTEKLSSADARLLTFGVELTLFDPQPTAAGEGAKTEVPNGPPDRDRDGIDDANDKCVDVPEDSDGHEDSDGCPEPDNDGDKIPDDKDMCRDAPEDFDEHDDADGCPDPDNDGDGFLDGEDQCPNEAEIVNGNKDFDGCPDEGLIEMKNDRIVLEERVLFDFERARVKREARPMLRAIVTLKAQHPEWVKLRIEGHADAQGDARYNQEVSEKRAENVMRELIKLGIPASQIEWVGYGSTRLRDKRNDEEAHARNRRVEFVVLARGAPGSAPETKPTAPTDDDAAEPEPAPAAPAAPSAPPASGLIPQGAK